LLIWQFGGGLISKLSEYLTHESTLLQQTSSPISAEIDKLECPFKLKFVRTILEVITTLFTVNYE